MALTGALANIDIVGRDSVTFGANDWGARPAQPIWGLGVDGVPPTCS